MLKIGVDARPLHFPRSGIGRYTAEILRGFLKKGGIELHLYSDKPLGETWNQVHQRTFGGAKLFNSVLTQAYYPIWASQDKLDVFWSPRHHLPLRIRSPSVVTIHDLVWKVVPETMAPGGKLLERLLMPKSIKKADKIICVSHSTQQDLAESFPDAEGKSCVIYEAPCTKPVPEEIFAQPESPFFLFVGTKEPRKNLHNCLVAWQQSQLSKAGFKLIIAGGRGWNFSLGDSIQLTGSAASVIDAQPSEVELRKLYATCHALIMPSLYEGFGLPLVEAMAFGKPMITSNVSSMPEIAGDAAIYVTADKVAELSKAFLTLAQNSELHNRLSKNAAKRATLFGWEKAVDQSLEVIIEAAGR